MNRNPNQPVRLRRRQALAALAVPAAVALVPSLVQAAPLEGSTAAGASGTSSSTFVYVNLNLAAAGDCRSLPVHGTGAPRGRCLSAPSPWTYFS